jgi:hypothetical protein
MMLQLLHKGAFLAGVASTEIAHINAAELRAVAQMT